MLFLGARLAAVGPRRRPRAKSRADSARCSTARTSPGWVTPEDKSLFTVENGEIVGRTKELLKKNEFLATDKPYGDFVLKAKVKFRNGNSGIQFRSKRTDGRRGLGPSGRRGR